MTHTASTNILAAVLATAEQLADQRKKCPRAAALLDEVQKALEAKPRTPTLTSHEQAPRWTLLEYAEALLLHDLSKERDITEEDAAYVREQIQKGVPDAEL